jgi:hypothetical protein
MKTEQEILENLRRIARGEQIPLPPDYDPVRAQMEYDEIMAKLRKAIGGREPRPDAIERVKAWVAAEKQRNAERR